MSPPSSETAQSSKYVFEYLPIRGRGESVRLLLEDIGVEYQDVRFSDNWPEEKERGTASGKYTFGQLPCLTIGEVNIVQTDAIMRHLARKFGYYGETEDEHTLSDVVAGGADDFRDTHSGLVYNPAFEDLLPAYLEKTLPKWLGFFEKLLLKNHDGEKYFVGKDATYPDFIVFELLSSHLRLDPNCLNKFPLLEGYHTRIANRPRIKAYLESNRRPEKINFFTSYDKN